MDPWISGKFSWRRERKREKERERERERENGLVALKGVGCKVSGNDISYERVKEEHTRFS